MNNLNKVIKVYNPPPIVLFYYILILYTKYINSILKVRFKLDTISKFKPITRPDNLLLLLV
jgi:hypothetical protein